jgi:hypothetical protein
LQSVIDVFQEYVRESGADSAGEKQSPALTITNQQRPEVLAGALRLGVAADDKLLLLGQLDFDPSTATPSTLIKRVRPFSD